MVESIDWDEFDQIHGTDPRPPRHKRPGLIAWFRTKRRARQRSRGAEK